MTRHVNFQRERFITLKRFVELLGKKNLRVYPSALQSSIYVTTRITVFILRAQMVIRTLTLEILFVFFISRVLRLHLHLILNKQKDEHVYKAVSVRLIITTC